MTRSSQAYRAPLAAGAMAFDIRYGVQVGRVLYRLPRTLLTRPGQLGRSSSVEIRRYDDQRAVRMVQHGLGD
jgi:hypothetical protein